MSAANVAGPRRPIGVGTYTGEELSVRSARPGAYDALKIPSVIGNRHVLPGTPREPDAPRPRAPVELLHRTAPPPPPAPPATSPQPWGRKGPKAYVPAVGGVPQLVIAALRAEGGHLSMSDVARRFGVKLTSVASILATPIENGALQRHLHRRRTYVSLPGYVLPTEEPEEPKAAESSASPADAAALAERLLEASTHAKALARSLGVMSDQVLQLGTEIQTAAGALSRLLPATPRTIQPT